MSSTEKISVIDFKNNKNLIHIGDHVCLRYSHVQNNVNHNPTKNPLKRLNSIVSKNDFDVESYRFLCSEGLLNEECFLTGSSDLFEDCLWEVHVQNQYSAQKEYKDSLESITETKKDNDTDDENVFQSGRAALNERRLNEKLMSLKVGRVVNFGDPIQLRHVKSNKFLTVSLNVLAEQERENLKIKVDLDGTSLSCFEFMPRYKFNKEGQPLTQGNDSYIRVHDKTIEFLHGTMKALSSSKLSRKEEVNSSLEPSTWTILKYQPYDIDPLANTKKNNIVLGGHLVTIQDPDNLSCLTIDHQSRDSKGRYKVVMSPQLLLQFQQQGGSQQVVDTDINVGTNLLWSVEKREYFVGGGISIRDDSCCLRDIITGLFMKLDSDNNLYVVPDKHDASFFFFRHSLQSPIDSPSLVADSPIHLLIDGKWVGFSNNQNTDTATNITTQSSLISRGVKLLRYCEGKTNIADAAPFLISTALYSKIGRSTYIGVDTARLLRNFNIVSHKLIKGENVLKDVGLGIREISSALESLISYLGGNQTDEHGKTIVNILNEELSPDTIRIRQAMMREQGILDVLLDIIETTETNIYNRIIVSMNRRDSIVKSSFELVVESPEKKDISDSSANLLVESSNKDDDSDAGSVNTKSRKSRLQQSLIMMKTKGSVGDNINSEIKSVQRDHKQFYGKGFDDDSDITVSQKIAHNCLKTLMYCIRNNKTNQFYMADRVSLILNLAIQQPLAVLCLQELLKNLQILQTKIRENEIDILVKLLSSSLMNTMILKLMQNTCSCPHGVDSTQRILTYALFGSNYIANNDNTKKLEKIISEKEIKRATMIRHNSDRTEGGSLVDALKAYRNTVGESFLIQIITDTTNLQPVKWKYDDLYNSQKFKNGALGYKSLMRGLPMIYVSWKNANGKIDMHQLFGFKEKIPLSQFFAIRKEKKNSQIDSQSSSSKLSPNSKIISRHRGVFLRKKQDTQVKTNTTRSTLLDISSMKDNIEKYFITQLYLIADLCLDRNYVAIGILENRYKYEMLLAILKQEDIPDECKAPISRIVQCLYVDREPQISSIFPRYIRTSKSLAGRNDSEKYEDINSTETIKFSLLQQILAEYIENDISLKLANNYSSEMTGLLQKLFDFGFYITYEQIQHVLNPLNIALESFMDIDKIDKQYNLKSTYSIGSGEIVIFKRIKTFFNSLINRDFQILPSDYDLNSDDEGHVAIPKIKWEQRWLDFTESIIWSLIVVIVVLLAVALVIFQISTDIDDPDYTQTFNVLNYLFTLFFVVELIMRLYCHKVIYKELNSFVKDNLNKIDMVLVFFDLVLLGYSISLTIQQDEKRNNNFGGVTRSVRIIRLLRLFRLARLLRIIRLYKKIREASIESNKWSLPKRYSKILPNQVETIVNILKIYVMIYDRVQDRKLDLIIQAFSKWCRDLKNEIVTNPIVVYDRVLASDDNELTVSKKLHLILLDLMMYDDSKLIQEALYLLMIYETQSDLLFQITNNVQIVYSPRMEKVCKDVTVNLKNIKRLAEMYEIWSNLETEDDLESQKSVMDSLLNIKSHLLNSNTDKSLDIKSVFKVDEEVQTLIRNSDGMAVLMNLQETLYDGGREKLKPEITAIMKSCNDLVFWFVKNSEVNQTIAFDYIKWLVERIDDNINSSKVVKAILEGNKELIKRCPRIYVGEFAQKILSYGRRPEYLDLYLGMTELSEIMETRVSAVESDISSYLTSREWKQHILLWCCSPSSDGYLERVTEMEKYNNLVQVEDDITLLDEDYLSNSLLYHLKLLSLLANCNLGPKIESIYNAADILYAMLDPATIFPVKKALANLLIAIMKNGIDKVERCEYFWRFLHSTVDMMNDLNGELLSLQRNPITRIQKGEWLELTITIMISFFDFFDINKFIESYNYDPVFTMKKHYLFDVNELLDQLHHSMKDLLESNRPRIGEILSQEISFCMIVMNQHIENNIDNIDSKEEETALNVLDEELKTMRAKHKRSSIIFEDVQQIFYRKQFKLFMHSIKKSKITGSMHNIFETIPYINDINASDFRFEPLVQKIATHLRSLIERSRYSISLESNVSKSATYFLKCMRQKFENLSTICIEDIINWNSQPLLEDNGQLTFLRNIYCECGLVELCLDLLALGVEETLHSESLKLLIILLSSSGGIPNIQLCVYEFVKNTDSILFFESLKDIIENLKSKTIKEATENESEFIMDLTIPDNIIIFKLIQLMCEGSFNKNQNIIREQTGNSTLVSVLDSMASYLGVLSKSYALINIYIMISILDCLMRLMQGPCIGNQEYLVLNTELLASINRIIRSSNWNVMQLPPNTDTIFVATQHTKLKKSLINTLKAIIEAQKTSSLVYERVVTTIDFGVLHLFIAPNSDISLNSNIDNEEKIKYINNNNFIQSSYITFLKSLGLSTDAVTNMNDNNNNLITSTDKINIMDKIDMEDDIKCIEIVSNKELYKVYFAIPPVCKELSKGSIDAMIDNILSIRHSSQENKLLNFVKQSRRLYRELMHQLNLKRYGLTDLWDLKFYITWIMFANAVLMNILILLYYGTKSGDTIKYALGRRLGGGGATTSSYVGTTGIAGVGMIESAYFTIEVLNGFQIAFAFITLSIYFIVRVPVTLSINFERNGILIGILESIIQDPLPLWYTIYFFITVISITVNELFLSLLLLDWVVLDATTSYLLLAVFYPAKQLAATMFIIMIVLYIFSGVIFAFFRQDIISGTNGFDIKNLWDTFKLAISYGFRGEYGIDHEMNTTMGQRMILDVAFYIIVLAIMREIFFAIIVDTFSKLRELKFERDEIANNSCFICGIERHTFDFKVNKIENNEEDNNIQERYLHHDFSFHRDEVHNNINYLYFIISIWLQHREDDNGVEIFVRRQLDNNNISWFPINSFSNEFEDDNKNKKKDLKEGHSQKNNHLIDLKLAAMRKNLIQKVEGQSTWNGPSQSTSIAVAKFKGLIGKKKKSVSIASNVANNNNETTSTPSNKNQDSKSMVMNSISETNKSLVALSSKLDLLESVISSKK